MSRDELYAVRQQIPTIRISTSSSKTSDFRLAGQRLMLVVYSSSRYPPFILGSSFPEGTRRAGPPASAMPSGEPRFQARQGRVKVARQELPGKPYR
jgi:hypothetical protein